MTHNNESVRDSEVENTHLRDKRFRRALAGLLIGSGVLATGTYITLDHILNNDPVITQEDSSHDNTTIAPDSWPEMPEKPLPPVEILTQDELNDFVDSQQR